MNKIISIEPAIDPNARPTFLLDWELTMKCNLDCSYCPTPDQTDISRAYHDNSADHPPSEDCIKTIDFMYEYVDLYMSMKPRWTRAVVLNIYGGESLFHPRIAEILHEVKKKHLKYQDKWPLTVTCTTNGVVGKQRMSEIVDLVDEFTVSFHAESLRKQKNQVKQTLLLIKQKNRRVKCIVLMHSNQDHWPDLIEHIEFCKDNNINYLPRHIDGNINSQYNQKQITWFKNLWNEKTQQKSRTRQNSIIVPSQHSKEGTNQTEVVEVIGRACCGGRLMSMDEDLKHSVFYIPNNVFTGWYCSVNWFFLYIKQHTKEVFTNKDCRMNFDGTVSPLGSLDNTDSIINFTKKMMDDKSMPAIVCAKDHCWCGLCAPKAEKKEDLIRIMDKHVVESILI